MTLRDILRGKESVAVISADGRTHVHTQMDAHARRRCQNYWSNNPVGFEERIQRKHALCSQSCGGGALRAFNASPTLRVLGTLRLRTGGVSRVLQRVVWGFWETEQGCWRDCGLFKALSVACVCVCVCVCVSLSVCVCVDSSFQINLPVWHTLCLTGEACHPRVPGTHFNIGETRWPLVHPAHSQAHPTPPSPLFLTHTPSPFHTLSFCHFHLSRTAFSHYSPLSVIFVASPPLFLSFSPSLSS